MLPFPILQQKARLLPEKLTYSYTNFYTLGGLFCPCISSFFLTDILRDASLIQRIAVCLDYYPSESSEKKLAILIGIYLYIWQCYDKTLQWVLNKPLFDILSDHLGIRSLLDLDDKMYKSCMTELDIFCNWVYQNRQFTELMELYRALPADMQANIHMSCRSSITSETVWSSRLSGFLNQFF